MVLDANSNMIELETAGEAKRNKKATRWVAFLFIGGGGGS